MTRRLLLTVAAALLAVGFDASGAVAGTATMIPLSAGGPYRLRYAAPPGETNIVAISSSPSGTTWTVTDPAGVTPGAHCTEVKPVSVRCFGAVQFTQVSLGDHDDRFSDTAVVRDVVDLGDGRDRIEQSAAKDGSDLITGGPDLDIVIYAQRTQPVAVSLGAGAQNDGEAGEHDDIGCDVEVVVGGHAGDTLRSCPSGSYATFYAGGGNDTLIGVGAPGSSLTLEGESGNDTLSGGPEDDKIRGGSGDDTMNGGAGRDTADYSEESSAVSIHLDPTQPSGRAGELDHIALDVEDANGGEGSDQLFGSNGDNALDGKEGDDHLFGGGGNDVLTGGSGNNSLLGGSGFDVASYARLSFNVTATIGGVGAVRDESDAIGADVEGLLGGYGDDTLSGDPGVASGVLLDGGFGSDTLTGRAGNDVLRGGAGLASDTISGGGGVDTVDYSQRTNPVHVSLDGAANDGENGENDDVLGDVEAVVGGDGNDVLVGGAAAETLVGGPGDDSLDGGPGADTLEGGAGIDAADYSARVAAVSVSLDGAANDGASEEADNVAVDVENVNGGAGNDALAGSDAANRLSGGAGNDMLGGGAGNDSLLGGLGDDALGGGLGVDVVDGGAGNDILGSRDTVQDQDLCGLGADTVFADLLDIVAPDCETVNRA